MIILEIFFAFIRIGLLCFGGAYASIPIVERQVVEVCGWMTSTEFADLVALDELTPGPILINSATFVGMKVGGVAGAIAATMGCIFMPCLISLTLVIIYRRYKNIKILSDIIHALKCMATAMVLSTCLTIMINAILPSKVLAIGNVDYLMLVMTIASLMILKKYKINPLYMMLICGAINLIVRGLLFPQL